MGLALLAALCRIVIFLRFVNGELPLPASFCPFSVDYQRLLSLSRVLWPS